MVGVSAASIEGRWLILSTDDRSRARPADPTDEANLDAPSAGGEDQSPETRGGRSPSPLRSAVLAIREMWDRRDPIHDGERRIVIKKLFPQGMSRRQFLTRFASLMLLSTAIAVFGILSDSTAVVIGAMLVAPLMMPVLGLAAAIVMGWPRRIFRRSALIILGAGLAVTLAASVSFVVPGRPGPLSAELMARTSPNLLDLGIALAAGAAGAYGQMRRHAADALTGVAVAVALVPPLAVVGITMQLAEWQLAFGALMLFLANVVGIVISAAFVFVAAGFVPGRNLFARHSKISRGLRWAAIGVIVIVLPLQFGRGNVLPPTDPTDEVTLAVHDFVDEEAAAAEVVSVDVQVIDGVVEIDVVVASPTAPPPAEDMARHLAEELDAPVQLSVQTVSTEAEGATITDP
jgi:uncharacterized hydrophobic protein (TIGR00271 family)